MKPEEPKNFILKLIEQEIQLDSGFISKERLIELAKNLSQNQLTSEDRREIADSVLSLYLEKDMTMAEDLIDWILRDQ